MSLPARIWRVPAYLPYLQPPLTDEMIAAAEAQLGVRLPKAYIAALQIQNGGYLAHRTHPDVPAPVDRISGIGPAFPSVLRRDWSDIAEHMKEEGITTPARLDDLVPFCGDGHYYVCFDYRETGRDGEPRITYIDVECFNHDDFVARDFETFLQALRDSADGWVVGLVTEVSLEDVAKKLRDALGHAFESRGDSDHGYLTYRAHVAEPEAWLWITPNLVSRGFVRPTDERYEELRERLPGVDHRYPHVPECGAILDIELDRTADSFVDELLRRLPFPHRIIGRPAR